MTHLLTTHAHGDHIAHHEELERRFGLTIMADPRENVRGAEPLGHGEIIEAGGLSIEALRTPGHSPGMLAFVVDGDVCFTGDTLFAGSVGGTQDAVEDLRRSIMDVLMGLPAETTVYPGHTDETTIGREWDSNPFIRIWRGLDPEGEERCHVSGREAQLVLWARDYDGGGKAWVRFPDGRDAIVGGSRVERIGR
jgi:glyoxylase-like metal-dependent hydrolase (beta-lactamase superfamily II)